MEKQEPFQLDVVSIRLVKNAPLFSDKKITNPQEAVSLVGEMLCEMDREVVCVINLKSDGTPINCNFASMGAINQAVAEPRELFKSAILSNAAKMILLHNHPSGRLEPSKEDTIMTDRILKLSVLLGIPLDDHIIVGGDNSRYFSFREKEILPMPSYMVKQNGKDGKSQYQDVCFPVTKEFREKLYDALMDCYKQEKEKAMNQGMEQAATRSLTRAESRQPEKDLPFR